ncbi:MAG: glycosyltransferase family 4 protein, partial [Actinomycetota bacterium]|nr:glycosyltransferase family 4 protein [Actinomycetota bacterium]
LRPERIGGETRGAIRGAPHPAGPGTMTILVTTDRRRGAEVQGERLTDGLGRLGWDVDLVALSTDPASARVGARPISARHPDRLGRLDLDVLRGLRRHLGSRRPDVLLANGSSTLQYAVSAVAGRRGPSLAYVSIGEPSYWVRSSARRAVYRWLLGRLDLVIAVSEMTRRQLVEEFAMPPALVEVGHTGVPASLLEVRPEPRSGPFRLLFLGSLSKEKDPQAALQVLARLLPSTPARLRFLGTGPLVGEVERQAGALGVADAVELAGAVSDIRPHLAWADALLLTSATEGLPGVVLEAGAAGVPTVAFDVGGTAETVVEGVTGRLMSPGDLEGLAEAARQLAQDEETRCRFGEEARRLVESRFLLEHSIERYHQLLLELRDRRPTAQGRGPG